MTIQMHLRAVEPRVREFTTSFTAVSGHRLHPTTRVERWECRSWWSRPCWSKDAVKARLPASTGLSTVGDHPRPALPGRGRRRPATAPTKTVSQFQPHQSRCRLWQSGQPAQRQRSCIHRPLPRHRPSRPRSHPAQLRHQVPTLPPLPSTCGKIERFHQTLKKWLTHQIPAPTVAQLQAQLDTFRAYYNTVRPHRALSRRTPQQAYLARPKATPTGTPLHAGAYRIRHDRIDSNGKLTLRHNSRLHHIGTGRRHAGTNVLLLIHELHIRVVTTDGHLLRELQLDPTKNYQPQTKP
jgi:Integrase core domain